MDIKYKDVCHTDFLISDIAAYKHNDASVYDYTQSGRVKHVVFYLYGHERSYYVDGKHVITLKPGDIIVIPHGTKYKSVVEDKTDVAKATVRKPSSSSLYIVVWWHFCNTPMIPVRKNAARE